MEKLIIVRTVAELAQVKAYIEQHEYIAFDTETNGTDKDSLIIGYSISAEVDVGIYVITREWNVATQTLIGLETVGPSKDILQMLVGKKLIMQNCGFDCARVQDNYEIDLMPSVHTDTMELAHLLDENRPVGLKALAVAIFGETSDSEQKIMKESVLANGGQLTKDNYELYKASSDLIARYGAKDAILTIKLFYHMVPQLYEQGLDSFFYDDESMRLLRGPTYDLNTTGLRVDPDALSKLKSTLQADLLESEAFIHNEIKEYIKDKYPGTSKVKTFNIGAGQQIAWLLFERLENEFTTLTDSGKDLCKALDLKMPYTGVAKRNFIQAVRESHGRVWRPKGTFNPKTKQVTKTDAKVGHPWQYMTSGKFTLAKFADKYKWCGKLMEHKKNEKLLSTYVEAIQEQMKYNIIRPAFLQHGTTSGRYSSRYPNFQNLPRDDKRVKACIVARPRKIFVGADQAQLEPRVFASFSKDERLMKSFENGEDFYSVVGAPIFGKHDATLVKDGTPNSFPVKYQKLRDVAKVVALATPYGTTPPQMASELAIKAGVVKTMQECQEIIDDYFMAYPSVEQLMLDAHKQAREHGVVYNLFGRPRRIPDAKTIDAAYGKSTPHGELPRAARNLLNLAMNHPIQSTGASIMNRAAIAIWDTIQELSAIDALWKEVKIILQVHDEIVLEGPIELEQEMKDILKYCMEETVTLPGVKLVAEPKSAYNLADLK